MPGRHFSATNQYRYGFNGKENDSETSTQDYGMRIYNPALGKFLSVDPLYKSYPYKTTYDFAENDPIRAIDLDGGEKKFSTNQSIYLTNWTSQLKSNWSITPFLYAHSVSDPSGNTGYRVYSTGNQHNPMEAYTFPGRLMNTFKFNQPSVKAYFDQWDIDEASESFGFDFTTGYMKNDMAFTARLGADHMKVYYNGFAHGSNGRNLIKIGGGVNRRIPITKTQYLNFRVLVSGGPLVGSYDNTGGTRGGEGLYKVFNGPAFFNKGVENNEYGNIGFGGTLNAEVDITLNKSISLSGGYMLHKDNGNPIRALNLTSNTLETRDYNITAGAFYFTARFSFNSKQQKQGINWRKK
jgi:RHS repeat-associated protein